MARVPAGAPGALRLLALACLLVAWLPGAGCGYNEMQRQEEAVFRAWGDLDAALQRRADLVPNLVETVKGAAAHERQTLEAVMAARAKATSVQISPRDLNDPQAMERFRQAQGELGGALSRLLAVAESYPDIKANQNFRDLSHQLEGTENRVAVARQRYNEVVETFNASIRTFPYSLTNSLLLHLERKPFFQAEEGARQAPRVNFQGAP